VNTFARVRAAVLFAVSLPAHAAPDFEACVVAATEGSVGTVESVRLVFVPRDLHAFDPDVLEHSVQPEEAQQLVVRLDAGPLVVFSQRRPQRLEAGERVRLHLDGGMARVERDPAACAG
jgi:hypothetical protein